MICSNKSTPSMKTVADAPAAPAPRLLDRVRSEIRCRHYSLRTEETYVDWIRRFILFHHKQHPADMGLREVEGFLSYLASERHVSASTQNQAKAALLFLYKRVLGTELPWLDGIVQAKPSRRLPVVLSPGEVRRLLDQMGGGRGVTSPLDQL
jgi:site-specific recombinase XerD